MCGAAFTMAVIGGLKLEATMSAEHPTLAAFAASPFLLFVPAVFMFIVVIARLVLRKDSAAPKLESFAKVADQYGPGTVIERGTHRLSDIFDRHAVRTDLVFKDCQIEGPGLIAFLGAHADHCKFYGIPKAQFIAPEGAADLAHAAFQFVNCKFFGCTFRGVAVIGTVLPPSEGAEVYALQRQPVT
jgi:hypothetical protein